MPWISRQERDGPDTVSRWLVATRAAALAMSLISAAVGGLLALREGPVRIWMWILAGIGLVMAHGTNNLLNDFVDYRRGVDRGNYFRDRYGPQTLETGFLSVRGLMAYAVFTGLVALACGVALALTSGWLTWVLIAGGVLPPVLHVAAVVRRFDVRFHPAVRHVVLDRVDRGYSPAPAQALASAIEILSGAIPRRRPNDS